MGEKMKEQKSWARERKNTKKTREAEKSNISQTGRLNKKNQAEELKNTLGKRAAGIFLN